MRSLSLVTALVMTSVTAAAPVPRAKTVPPFPITVGDTREYEWRTADKSEAAHTDEVTKSESQPDNSTRVTLRRTYAQGSTSLMTIHVTASGVSRIADGDQTLKEPVVLLKLPATVATKWESGGSKYEVLAEEEVTVAAGKYQTVKVEMTSDNFKTILWFAPTVGLVKMKSGESPRILELKTFKPGK